MSCACVTRIFFIPSKTTRTHEKYENENLMPKYICIYMYIYACGVFLYIAPFYNCVRIRAISKGNFSGYISRLGVKTKIITSIAKVTKQRLCAPSLSRRCFK